jgi:hypothetical protein
MARYRFRFDAKGLELDRDEPAPAVPSAAIEPSSQGAVAAPEGASPPRPLTGAASRPDPATVVTELKEWLEEHPGFGLDMERLEEREVLITPPHWSYVSTAPSAPSGTGANIGANIGMSPEEHRQAVRKYARMLGDRQLPLEEALALAAFAGVASTSNDPAEKLRDALKALPKGAKMHLATMLESIPDGMSRLLKERLPPLLKQGKAREWAGEVLHRHEEIVSSTPEPEWVRLEAANWEKWRERFQLYRRRRRDFDLDVNDLLLRTRRAGPAALFRNELARMTLREWSEALLIATRRTEERSELEIPEWVLSEVQQELMRGRKTMLVILGESATSPTAQWLPSKQHGCLWIEAARWFEYYDALRLGEPNSITDAIRWYVAVEVSGDPDTLAQLVRRDVVSVFGSPPAVPVAPEVKFAYLGKEKLPTQVTPIVPYLENVKGVDEAIGKLDILMRSSRPAS